MIFAALCDVRKNVASKYGRCTTLEDKFIGPTRKRFSLVYSYRVLSVPYILERDELVLSFMGAPSANMLETIESLGVLLLLLLLLDLIGNHYLSKIRTGNGDPPS